MPADRETRVPSSVAYTKVWPGSPAAEKKLDHEGLQRQGSVSTIKAMEKGDPLPTFVAKVSCLLWFEEISTLQAVEDCQFLVPRQIGKIIPTPGFQRWVATILSIMQVSENVIFLALGLMYRLKSSNWEIGGQNVSEFVIVTVALMLSNKYLDDFPYSNRAWSEVSCISLHQIHSFEIEFLRHINYDLFSSEGEWPKWRSKLHLFGKHCHSTYKVQTLEA